ncbi:hypothetical protein SERLA73DRAFT_119817 [Serpula lacrymans var. lacrymans S7.3]|uniref:GYF domain-containing protein n=1 Tax=Serpula lacrymans var. lacrymans (strain S7.3) TaxID=936435 RepID=F8PME7_SERL3|nr:hypothetical protein SERLA73DRAFT_119817 [Serpula lacrymans var. lacrymans S7.3]
MTTTTMHFGPEWMRTKHQPSSRSQPPPSPPPPASYTPQTSASTYSALVSSAPPEVEKRDESHPFRYSKEDMLRIYKEGGGRGGLGLEVERWEGVVREVANEPIALREMGDGEKKVSISTHFLLFLFAGPLNSDLRRRQSSDVLGSSSSPSDRARLPHSNSGGPSPMRERYTYMGRRRDSTDQPPMTLPRKLSLSTTQGPLASPRDGGALPSPRNRIGAFASGFDGVLSGGDSWVARRRASEGMLKSAGAPPAARAEHGESDNKGPEIKEEEEENPPAPPKNARNEAKSGAQQSSSPPAPLSAHIPSNPIISETYLESGVANMSLNNNNNVQAGQQIASGMTTSISPAGPPPGLPDVSTVEWSYLDPQGQVQGPFPADLMQKWHDEGYFTPNLLMKRTHLDTEWIPVGELARRAIGGKVFLSQPFNAVVPPGLSLRTESPLASSPSPQDHNSLNGHYQPVPTRSLRTSTLDSYINAPSNTSDSPPSSLGAARFSNGSPDPSSFGGRGGNMNMYSSESTFGGRGFVANDGSPFSGGGRGAAFHETAMDSRSTYGNVMPGIPVRAPSVDSFGYGTFNGGGTPWPSTALSNSNSGFDNMGNGRMLADGSSPFSPGLNGGGPGSMVSSASTHQGPVFNHVHNQQEYGLTDNSIPYLGTPDYNAIGSLGVQHDQQNMGLPSASDKSVVNGLGFTNATDGLGASSFGNQTPSPFSPSPMSYNPSQQQQQQQQHHPSSTSPFEPALSQPHEPMNSQASHVQPAPPSPWNTPDPSAVRRARPFDAPQSTVMSHATVAVSAPMAPAPQPSGWGRGSQVAQPAPEASDPSPSPWLMASLSGVDDAWREVPGPNSLTFSNLGQHNQLQKKQRHAHISADDEGSSLPAPAVVAEVSPERLVSAQPPVGLSAPAEPSPPKTRRKSTVREVHTQASLPNKPAPALAVPAKTPSPTPANQAKHAWSTEEDVKKAKPSGSTMSLREIQDAEAKKVEARKAAEKERDRSARAAVTPASEEVQPFTASWGLPTSQVGVRGVGSPKEGATMAMMAGTTPPSSGAPVWTNAISTPSTKKTMKEIQEEEERWKKLAVKETMAATAARRAYAETTNKVCARNVVPQTGGAWTTVGPGGKSSAIAAAAAAAAAAPVRPAMTSSISSGSVAAAPRVNGTTPSRPATTTTVKAAAAPPKIEDFPISPSHDFLKWMTDSLKGLNNSVHLEEIAAMLLSFPMDPDPSTVEIISDLIYANSTTLDGRRFAAEFVSKRKMDAAARKGNAAPGTSGKVVSIADVVKTQPKPTQPEWGGFKVVNKKKKGGRS